MSKKLLLLLASTVVALLLAEGSLRAMLALRGDPYSAAATERAVEEVLAQIREVVPTTSGAAPLEDEDEERAERGLPYALHPYTGFTLTANLVELERTVRDLRVPTDDTFDILLTGGSVAAIFCGKEGGYDRLADHLRADPRLAGRVVRLYRLAIPGFKQPQQLTALAYLLARGARPDLVLNFDGLNEIRMAFNNVDADIQPTYPSVGHWSRVTTWDAVDPESLELLVDVAVERRRAAELAASARRQGWSRSAIAGRWLLSRLAQIRARWARAQERYVQHEVDRHRGDRHRPFGVEPEGENVLEEAVACWEQSSLAMHDLCAPLGIRYVEFLQPTLHDEGSKPVTREEWRKGIGKGKLDARVKAGYPLLREGCARLAAQGVHAFDLSGLFRDVEETLYYDSCHFGKQGNLLVAERVYALLDGIL